MIPAPATGVVLAGAAALGAYEAGVLQHIVDAVARDLERPQLFDIVSGTSAGAINAAALAAFADRPAYGADRACTAWSELRLGQVLRPSAIELLLALVESRSASSRLSHALRIRGARGGLLDPQPITKLLTALLPIDRVGAHLAAGILRGVAISATHIATGRATVFYQTARPLGPWHADRGGAMPVPSKLGLVHAMASAAIPLLFPPVMIDGDLYCDGGLRQMVPLSPSVHLGADRLLVINPLTTYDGVDEAGELRAVTTSPFYLAGKALNALFADRTEVDLARVEQLTGVLRAGRRRYGPTFDAEINAELQRVGAAPLREVSALRIDPSRDLGRLAAEYVTSRAFAKRERGVIGRLMRCLADAGPTRTGDLLSYLLFDGGFAAELIALGKSDARARHSEICAFFGTPLERTIALG
jgi:NTE family protein